MDPTLPLRIAEECHPAFCDATCPCNERTATMRIFTPNVRKGIYALAIAVLGVTGVYGLTTPEQGEAIGRLVSAAVALLAFLNVSDQ